MALANPHLLVCALAFMTAGMSAAAERSAINWEELAPPQPAIEDPFVELAPEQLDALRMIARFEAAKDKSTSYITAEQAENLRNKLLDEGLDVEWLFKQREIVIEERRAQAAAVNPNVIGKEVRIPGYVIPLEFEGQKVTSFLLVPYAGACIHTPPPPANQMVHVTYPDGIEVSGLFTPVWIEGKMNAEFSVQDVGLSDGGSRVEVGYEMSANDVYLY
ncbi:DUF3299 domain-containing protein [Phaeobacter gallaeciensis]|uniref:DUF3299 domain-containing protein n=2 Tax=Roseobacteraceae TaxID=2854170 RepID=A0A366XAJ4_9RHOB|nr:MULTISPECIES: DUF3299 domain-containing protein [Roseobacteraceae]MBT3139716.1 DUF3299 domain-containing protein [Falsiruegeria litorea]MBT8169606.1 DUF3299 domain-containing protein [Falsiruegeria litorea]RBW58745.1 DUF3299 domain-containing protein [Ruegeria sp. A3M17]RBW61108.1 DUF3299 domain-containing protein [Phaeobacter gallaeciensis]